MIKRGYNKESSHNIDNLNQIYQKLIKSLIKTGYLKSPRIIRAFLKVDRALFVPKILQHQAYWNVPLSIGYGQTISQPLTVAFMLEKLEPCTGDKILDLGSGSGWQTALLAEIVGQQGQIFAVEIIPELLQIGKQNVRKLGYKNVKFYLAKRGILGWPGQAPFDKIIAAAASQNLPRQLINQLKPGGRMILPIQNSIWQIDKIAGAIHESAKIKKQEFPGFIFVPLVQYQK